MNLRGKNLVSFSLHALLLFACEGCLFGTKHDPRNFWTPDYEARIEEFAVLDKDKKPIWRIRGPGSSTVARIEYGSPPSGFHQEIPTPPQKPRPLVDGEILMISAKTDEAFFEHDGTAIGPDAFRGGVYEWTPRRR